MASVVGKTIFSDGKGKLFFGYYKTDDAVEFVDYKTWKKLSFKDVSKGDTNKERVIKAIVKNQKQFNKKVDFNMWAKQKKRTFEETMDWFIQNGWISNVTKRGIKESVDVLSVNEDTKKRFDVDFYKGDGDRQTSHEEIIRGDKFSDVVSQATKVAKSKAMNYVEFYHKDAFIGSIDKRSGYKFKKGRSYQKSPLSVNEATSSMSKEIASMTGTRQPAVQQFIDKHNINALKLAMYLNKQGLRGRMDFVTALAGKPGNSIQKKMIKMFQESVNEANTIGKMAKKYKNKDKFISAFFAHMKKNYGDSFKDFEKDKGYRDNIGKIWDDEHGVKESVNEGISVSDERHFGKKGIIIMIDDNGKKVSAIFKDKKNADKYNRNNPSDIKKLLDLAKKTKYPNAIDESVNEGKKRFNTKYGVGKSKYVVNYHDGKKKHKDGSDFFDIKIFKNKPELEAFKKDLVSKGFVKESVNEAKFGYKTSTASYIKKHKDEYKQAEKMNKGNEMKFYDMLQQMEDKVGHPKTMLFISNALRGYGVDMYKDPKIKNPADAQEALFLLSK